MAATPIAFKTKDNANAQLSGSISASSLSIVLNSGQGANFPQPYQGTCTSGGTATTLNCTGISATIGGSAQVGNYILNFTDGSVAIITAVSTNSLTTTALLGGTDNTWENSDAWRIDEFVLTLEKHDSATPYNVTQREETRVYGRSTDTLQVASTSERGYNGSTPASFAASDYAYLHVTSPVQERLKDVISVLAQKLDAVASSQAADETSISQLQTNYDYVVATGSANAYAASLSPAPLSFSSNYVEFKANFTNTGSATLNLNGLGAKTIKKNDGATNLAANDIVSGQVVRVRYDGTNWQMLSPIGTPATITYYDKTLAPIYSDSAAAGASSTSIVYMDTHTYTISANDLINGVVYEFEVGGTFAWAAGTISFNVGFGSTDLCNNTAPSLGTPAGAGTWYARGTILGTAAAGASVQVRTAFFACRGNTVGATTANVNVATNGSLTLQWGVQYGTSNGGNGAKITMSHVRKGAGTTFS